MAEKKKDKKKLSQQVRPARTANAAFQAAMPAGPPTAFDAGPGVPPPPPAPVMPMATDPPAKPVNLDAIEARRQELRAKLAQGMQAYRATGQLPAGWQDPAKAVPVTPMGAVQSAFMSIAPTPQLSWQDQATARGLANPQPEQATYDELVSSLKSQADMAMSAANPLEGRMGNVYDRGIGLTQELYGTGYVPNYTAMQGTAADPFAPGEREQLQQIASMQAHNEAMRQGIRSNGEGMSPAYVGTLGNPYGPDMGRQDIAGIGDRERMNQERMAQLAGSLAEQQQRAQALVGKQYSGGSVVRQRPDGSVYVTGPNAGSQSADAEQRRAATQALMAQRLQSQREREQAARTRMLAARQGFGSNTGMYERWTGNTLTPEDMAMMNPAFAEQLPAYRQTTPEYLAGLGRAQFLGGLAQSAGQPGAVIAPELLDIASGAMATGPALPGLPPMPNPAAGALPAGDPRTAGVDANATAPWSRAEQEAMRTATSPEDLKRMMFAVNASPERVERAIAQQYDEEIAARTMRTREQVRRDIQDRRTETMGGNGVGFMSGA